MHLLSYTQVLVGGGATSVLALGVWVWMKSQRSGAGLLFGLLSFIFAFWATAPWITAFGSIDRNYVLIWNVLNAIILCLSPALSLHTSSYLANKSAALRTRTVYFVCSLVSALMILGLLLNTFDGNNSFGSFLLRIAVILGLSAYALVLLFIIGDHYPKLLIGQSKGTNSFSGTILLSLFLTTGMLQLVYSPVAMQLYIAAASFVFFVIAAIASVRTNFLGATLLPLEGFFIVLIGTGAILLLHVSDAVEFWLTLAAVVIIALYGRMAIVTVSKEMQHSRQMAEINKELRDLEEARADFTAMVAHQLRGPIGGIRAAAASLVDGVYGELPPQSKKAAVLLKNASERLLGMAETYLQGIKLHQGTFVSQRNVVAVREIIFDVIRDLKPIADVKRLPIKMAIANLPEKLFVDHDVLENSLFNLIDNAVKYTEAGQVMVSANWKPSVLTITIEDTGIGMSAADLRGCFERFGRGSSSHARQKEGTGLGLYIVKRLVQAAGGRIQAKSPGLDRGSAFILTLPAEKVDQPKV